MNVVKLYRNTGAVKLIRSAGAVTIIRPKGNPVRLENTRGVVHYGGNDASQIKINTHLIDYYQLRKQC